ncbi:MAG TPA: YceI family protein [Ktedonobacterales bacterium]|jgi:polyisoprenoid-binding protein YceI
MQLLRRYTRWLIGAIVVVVIIIAAFVGYSIHFANNVAQSESHTPAGTATACGTVVPITDLRTFKIVPAQSTASYSVHEDLILENNPNAVAVGTTHSVTGSFQIRATDTPLVASVNMTVDLSTLKTDQSRRDEYVRRNALETNQYPTATFASTCAANLPASYTEGQQAQFQVTGNLTMHGTTNAETADVQGTLSGNTVTGIATLTVFMTDFNIQPPNLANLAIAQNKVLITIAFTATES